MTQLELLRYALTALERDQIPYAVVGSFASGVWGEPRMTLDIDVVVQLESHHMDAIMASFPAPEFYVSRTAADEAIRLQRQFNVIHPTSGGKIDFIVVDQSGWPAAQLARRRRVRFLPDFEGFVASPEDVVLGKLVYHREGGSDKHLRDIAGILKVSAGLVDHPYLDEWANKLNVAEVWRQIADSILPS